MIQLSNIAPDFGDLVTQLTAELQTKDTWKDRLTSSTGQTMVELIAAIGAYSQYSIESSFQESYPESAKNSSSLYAAANFLGVRLNRKLPASVQVSMVSETNITVPVNSKFNGAGTYWFNRQSLTLSPVPTVVTLYQGKIVETQTFGIGTDFQAFISPETEFSVSDTDVFLKINGVSIPAIQEGLWTKQLAPGAQHFTLSTGQMILLFGNSIYGSKPSSTDLCTITYVVTLGVDGSNIPTVAKRFSMENNATVTGLGQTQASGGGNQSNPQVYKNITPAIFGSFNSAVTPAQYKKLPLQYPGVIDANLLAQREANPRALSWMNLVKVGVLTQTPWSGTDWDNFEDWFYKNTMYSTRIFREDPVPIQVVVTADIQCKNLANLGSVKLKVETALAKLFSLRQGIIGLDVYRSDITNTILSSDSNIDYVILKSPVSDIVLSSLSAAKPTLVISPTGGVLGPGIYDYAVSFTSTLGGETSPAHWSTIKVDSGTTNRITLTWDTQPDVVSWKVWGRLTPSSMGLLGTFGPNVTTFVDTGTVIPTGEVPVRSTISSYYPVLQSSNLALGYTNRDSSNF